MTAPTRGPQQVPDPWDAVSATYAEDMYQWQVYADEALRLLPVAASDRVLDHACGPGTLAFRAAPAAARVDAIDFSSGMIEQLRARGAREAPGKIEGAVMDAHALAFPDATFDLAYSLFSFFFFVDRAHAFRELARVLKPGGRALIATWGPIERRPLMKIGFDSIAAVMPGFPLPSKGALQDPDECVREMTDAGFRQVSARIFTASVQVDGAEHYFELVARSAAPFAAMRKKVGEEAWGMLRARVVDAVRERLPEGGGPLTAEAIFTTGTR